MSYSSFGQTAIPGLTLPGELPTGQLVVPLPGGGTYTVGGSQVQAAPPKPKEPSESAIKWTELAAGAVGVVVGLATLYAMVHQRKSYKSNAHKLTAAQRRALADVRDDAYVHGPQGGRMADRLQKMGLVGKSPVGPLYALTPAGRAALKESR